MRQRLAPRKILAALQRGDAGPLIQFHRETFGDAVMMADDGDDTGGDDDGDDGDDGDDSSGGDDPKDDEKDPRVKKLSDENAKHRTANVELKKANADLAARLKAIEDKDKSELDKTTGDLTDAQAKVKTLEARNQELAIQNAFLSDNKHSWANPKTALKLADLSEVEIDEDGTVTGLDKALDKLAKSDPYLLKGKDDDDEGDGPQPPTGQPVTKKAKGNPDREKLLKKYPALNR